MTPAIVENKEKKREKYLMKKRCKMELHYTHFRCHLCFGGEVGKTWRQSHEVDDAPTNWMRNGYARAGPQLRYL